ncbi:FMN reductase [Salinibacterium sp. NSLL150]|uniref:FMN reductase n=1 Tax=unclassified Salinibacterium TaxID=2632331 RepID=UPI0018CD3D88|nr:MULTISPECIES: FMN reductase [unclassified Salinibacterium]MBH0100098.1 FMN reductase [Salinibacterium sp. NSLL35]MBH0102852.1 FMN reductase [Salinibacterium sp. NSLL150]MBH0105612.1 FMN reductase [Salinibacterium sp. NSLL16]MBH0108372.1 FMN reductase [Salinibacterium sp. NSLL17]MBH0111150.1 FMN reductase [Salinibacterium sp. NG22]
MSDVKKIAVIAAGLSQPSSTRLLADRLTEATVNNLRERGVDAEVTVIELRDLAHDVTNNLLTGFPSTKLDEAIAAVTGADGLIAVTPIFTTSYSGLFKSFIDVLDPQSLTDLPVLLGATGGTDRHSLAIDYAMRPLFSYLHAVAVPTGVYAASADWGSGAGSASSTLPARITRAAGELAALAAVSDRSDRVIDPFALPEGFSPVGSFGAQ